MRITTKRDGTRVVKIEKGEIALLRSAAVLCRQLDLHSVAPTESCGAGTAIINLLSALGGEIPDECKNKTVE